MVIYVICPRCGLPYSWLDRRVVGDKVYLYAVHVVERKGRSRKIRKCYLGPEESYRYVSMMHEREGLVLKGLADGDRALKYLDAIINYLSSIELDRSLAKELTAKLKQLAERLERYAEETK